MKYFSMTKTVLACLLASLACAQANEHPRLLLTPEAVSTIRSSLDTDTAPGFARSLAMTQVRIDAYFTSMPAVPRPEDAGGGYTHEQHKRNGLAIYDSGMLYQLTGEQKYARYARDLLLAYAELYPSLGEHPKKKEQSPGRLFWQSLNEAVWLVYVIQGYDAIIETLSEAERSSIQQRLLRVMADFLSAESPETFDKIHNHGTWAVAAVGMTGYVLGDAGYVKQALYGLKEDGEAGFIKQIDVLFSPDGYYTEGPYYQRYALMPFLLFARSIQTNDPGLKIFQYRDKVLIKAIYACIDMSYAGLFFPLNDAIKDKGLDTVELRYGIAIAYALTGDAELLSIAERQKSFVLTGDGFKLAEAIDRGRTQAYDFQSVLLRDGQLGDQGALAVLRSGSEFGHQALVFKATAQGLGHGHFDKLNWLFYDNGQEIITDYGAARFLNIEQKYGGHYLPENTTWAKQTVAHNTLVVDEQSHFNAKLSLAERYHPKSVFFDTTDKIHIVGASMSDVYDDVSFTRTLALIKGLSPHRPVVIDILHAASPSPHQYDLPLHFKGHIIDTNVALRSHTQSIKPLGTDNGYQHLWLRAEATVPAGEIFSLTWLNRDRFYTYTTLAEKELQMLFTELGANDPDFNLRNQLAMLARTHNTRSHSFISTLEAHGEYNGAEEFTTHSTGSINILARYTNNGADLIRIKTTENKEVLLGISYDPRPEIAHHVSMGDRRFAWTGYYKLFDLQGVSQ